MSGNTNVNVMMNLSKYDCYIKGAMKLLRF